MHHIDGYIANYEELIKQTPCKVVRLHEDMGFLPRTYENDRLLRRFGERFKGRIAFVETDYFGGAGDQFCAVWENGKRIYSQRNGPGINGGLKLLGVVRGDSDEFDAVGLGEHRTNEDFLGVTP